MIKKMFSILCVMAMFSIEVAHANVEVNFVESAPKDRFVIKNIGQCDLNDMILEIDLLQSAGKLIFDTTEAGAGVEVFQPFEVTRGDIKLLSQKGVNDGDVKLSLSIPSLGSGKTVSFTIDIDDTLPVSKLGKIRVAGTEIENGMVNISVGKQKPSSASFSADSRATVLQPPCSKVN